MSWVEINNTEHPQFKDVENAYIKGCKKGSKLVLDMDKTVNHPNWRIFYYTDDTYELFCMYRWMPDKNMWNSYALTSDVKKSTFDVHEYMDIWIELNKIMSPNIGDKTYRFDCWNNPTWMEKIKKIDKDSKDFWDKQKDKYEFIDTVLEHDYYLQAGFNTYQFEEDGYIFKVYERVS